MHARLSNHVQPINQTKTSTYKPITMSMSGTTGHKSTKVHTAHGNGNRYVHNWVQDGNGKGNSTVSMKRTGGGGGSW